MFAIFATIFILGIIVSVLGTGFHDARGIEGGTIGCAIVGFIALVVGFVGLSVIIMI